MNIADQIISKLWIKVTKKLSDDRTTLCGQDVIKDPNGVEPDCFYIPAHQGSYQPYIQPNYTFDGENPVTDKEYEAIKEAHKKRVREQVNKMPEVTSDYLDKLLNERQEARGAISPITPPISTEHSRSQPIYNFVDESADLRLHGPLDCLHLGCNFVAKSNAGKVAHERSHAKEVVPV